MIKNYQWFSMDSFQAFLSAKKLVREKNIPFCLHWISLFNSRPGSPSSSAAISDKDGFNVVDLLSCYPAIGALCWSGLFG
jgi:hypothetical protein